MKKTGVLLINLGSPASPSVKDVRAYLREFLSDERVIDIPKMIRNILLYGIILPIRSPKSAKAYKGIWTEEGSPLVTNTQKFAEKIKNELPQEWVVDWAMRYGKPNIASILQKWQKLGVEKMIVMPLYPQYASSSSGTAMEAFYRALGSEWNVSFTNVTMVKSFYNHSAFIDAWQQQGKVYTENQEWDHVLFSFHGLPERHVKKSEVPEGNSISCLQKDWSCCKTPNPSHSHCYRAHCYGTATQIAQRLHIPEDKYTICFQSRLGKDPWVQPYTQKTLEELAQKGTKRILIFSPSFVADCLETLEELAEEYRDFFIEKGGEELQLVPSLNDSDAWVQGAAQIIREANES
jgi:ferrochelatase